MPDTVSVLRCAVHPARAAHDVCPNCERPRCDEDASSFATKGCAACATVATAPPPSRSTRERVIAAGLAGMPVAVVGGWIYSQYVQVPTFSWLVPILIGVAGASAATAVWQRGGATSGLAVAIGLVASVFGTAFGFRLYPHGPHDPLHPLNEVGVPYLCTVAGALLWPLVLGPPRKPKTERGKGSPS